MPRAASPWLLRDAVPDDHEALVRVWRRAVEATHDFLTDAAVEHFEEQVRRALPRAAVRVACEGDGTVVGFLGGRGGEVDMLFVDTEAHGRGAGRRCSRRRPHTTRSSAST